VCCTENLTPTTPPSENDEEDLLVFITRQSSKGVTSAAPTKRIQLTTFKPVLRASTTSRKPSTFPATTKPESTTQLTKPPLRVSGVASGSTTTKTVMTMTTKTLLDLKPAEPSSSTTPSVLVPVSTSTTDQFPMRSTRVPQLWQRRPQQG
jgi:hypothetical protein